MPDLFPTFPVPVPAAATQRRAGPTYGKGLLFDWETGDFVLDGAGRLVETDGHSAWVHWCLKAVQTERFAHLVYGPGYGTELRAMAGLPSRAAVQSHLERAITEALLADPRTEAAQQFAFAFDGDAVTLSFTAVPVIGTPEKMEVTLRG